MQDPNPSKRRRGRPFKQENLQQFNSTTINGATICSK